MVNIMWPPWGNFPYKQLHIIPTLSPFQPWENTRPIVTGLASAWIFNIGNKVLAIHSHMICVAPQKLGGFLPLFYIANISFPFFSCCNVQSPVNYEPVLILPCFLLPTILNYVLYPHMVQYHAAPLGDFKHKPM